MKRNGSRGKTSQNPHFAVVENRTPEVNHHWSRPAKTRNSNAGTRDISYSQNDNVAYNDDGLLEWV